jgi:hypothetical protein
LEIVQMSDNGSTPRMRLYANADAFIAPIRGADWREHPWQGVIRKKPWQYNVTAAIVHLDTPDLLATVLEILRAQTERPFLHIIDSGSSEENRAKLEQMEFHADDLEITYLRPRAWRYSSEPVAASMDCAFALCKTEYLYSTHTDVFLKRQNHIEWLLARCDEDTPAVGYQMSPRLWTCDLWKRILSHTSTLYHMRSMRRYGVSWSMQAASEALGSIAADPLKASWPDTEVNVGLCLHRAGIGERWLDDPDPTPENPSVLMIGTEPNVPYEDDWLEHVRSTTLHNLYGGDGLSLSGGDCLAQERIDRKQLLAAAMHRAQHRVAEWHRGGGPRIVRSSAPEHQADRL